MEENPIESNQNSRHFDEESDDLCQISPDVDQYIDAISGTDGKASDVGEFPALVRTFKERVEERLHSYNAGDSGRKFGENAAEDAVFIESVRRMTRLTKAMCKVPNADPVRGQTTAVLQGTMVFLGEEFRTLLEDSRSGGGEETTSRKNMNKHSSFDSKNQHDHCEEYQAYPPELVARLSEIASTMAAAGHEKECRQVYTFSRRTEVRNYVVRQGYEVEVNTDDVAKMQWDSLEKVICRWIHAVKACSEVIVPAEKKLVDTIFSDSHKARRNLLGDIVSVAVVQLLGFTEVSAKAKRSADRLFRYLDMHEALQSLIRSIGDGESSENDEVIAEISSAAYRISEAAASNFCDLENSIKSDSARTPVPGGAVHPLTCYVMNYLKYACEYKDTLEKIFQNQRQLSKPQIPNSPGTPEKESGSPHDATVTPFASQVLTVMNLLDSNLDEKSKLYKDQSLHYIFLMNNRRYILQKVKNSGEIQEVVGDTWCRKRSTIVRLYHKNYQRETWNRLMHCLSQEGLIGSNGKVHKQVLKERLKTFTAVLEEIHKSQSGWVVSDEQLQSELRISISSVVVPAYRSFIGRFRNYLSDNQVNKYIKYQPDDVETMIEGLFEGHASGTPVKKS